MSNLSTKERIFQDYFPKVFKSTENEGKTWASAPSERWGTGSQSTDSEGHFRDRKTGNWSGGGPFQTATERWDFPSIVHDYRFPEAPRLRTVVSLGTPILGTLPSGDNYTSKRAGKLKATRSLSSLDPYGATAIAQCAPTIPTAEAASAIGELVKDGLPSIPGIRSWKDRIFGLKQLGDEYLNSEFGWKPLVSDVKSHSEAIRKSRDIVHQYRRDSGRNVRRGFGFPTEKSESSTTISKARPTCVPGGGDALPSYMVEPLANYATLVQSRTVETNRWFEGAFTYHVPTARDFAGGLEQNADLADRLFGIQPTPETLWELTPWSWGIDWFTNAGDVIRNFTQLTNQGLVMRYGFVMEETSIHISNRLVPTNGHIGVKGITSVPDSSYSLVIKSRRAANPFGFGISWEGLSPTQLAITAALGITRVL
ncbi:maturation protein [ssRNA phage Zoerhiza.2_9]|uniref:Maturation protein n=2 Tax=Leviviricetes TaxID=2842243 RepID=A0A8S5L3X7_9VIRU|nr:maturation protein [ssRNA phage Zoerhiza.2_9]QDH88879.1 MAG: hypothetical protein H2Rhizo31617_000003 [Leviviridae sp.]DAD52219.1 TPA_asm: maturation protein [ssRNA phage Zoerhiza.2_9]